MRRKQLGVSVTGLIVTLSVLGVVAVFGAKLAPAYIEAQSVKKILKLMAQGGQTKGTVKEIRYAYEKLNGIEDVKSVRGDDLEVTKQGGETVVSANWSVRVPIGGNVFACLDFSASTASQ